ncbi:hypothetical protein BLD25_01115 [Candidatus Gracilibacteria bacterium GN02-872]|nr:hypothetical protein BLD25_01115 [Candidatus Gracilibacteria bacterium GN02-872]
MKKIEFKKYGIKSEILDLILMKNLKISKKELFLIDEIDKKFIKSIEIDLEKFKKGVPIEYILEKANFFGIDFFVNNRVLIPRNDTEILVSECLKLDNIDNFLIIDIGTGSSAILASIMENTNIKKGIGIDISKEALEVAKKNIKNLKLEKKVILLKSDLLEILLRDSKSSSEGHLGGEVIFGKNLLITANLPYIKENDFKNMSKEVIQFEPNLALFGGKETGFELYEKLISQIFLLKDKYFLKKIILFIEIGFDQKEYCKKYLQSKNLSFDIFIDNSGIERCVKISF